MKALPLIALIVLVLASGCVNQAYDQLRGNNPSQNNDLENTLQNDSAEISEKGGLYSDYIELADKWNSIVENLSTIKTASGNVYFDKSLQVNTTPCIIRQIDPAFPCDSLTLAYKPKSLSEIKENDIIIVDDKDVLTFNQLKNTQFKYNKTYYARVAEYEYRDSSDIIDKNKSTYLVYINPANQSKFGNEVYVSFYLLTQDVFNWKDQFDVLRYDYDADLVSLNGIRGKVIATIQGKLIPNEAYLTPADTSKVNLDNLDTEYRQLKQKYDSFVANVNYVKTQSGHTLYLDKSFIVVNLACTGSMLPMISCSDLILEYKPDKLKELQEMDIVSYVLYPEDETGNLGFIENETRILHRVYKIKTDTKDPYIDTQGDNNYVADLVNINFDRILGKAVTIIFDVTNQDVKDFTQDENLNKYQPLIDPSTLAYTYHYDSDYRVSMEYPSTWELDGEISEYSYYNTTLIRFLIREDNESFAVVDIYIISEKFDISLGKYTNNTILYYESPYQEKTIIDQSTSQLSGKEAHKLLLQDAKHKYTQLWTVDSGDIFEVSYYATKDDYDRWYPVAEHMIKSFKILEKDEIS